MRSDRCRQLAKLGYVAFALDIYGKGERPANPQAAGLPPRNSKTIADFIASD